MHDKAGGLTRQTNEFVPIRPRELSDSYRTIARLVLLSPAKRCDLDGKPPESKEQIPKVVRRTRFTWDTLKTR